MFIALAAGPHPLPEELINPSQVKYFAPPGETPLRSLAAINMLVPPGTERRSGVLTFNYEKSLALSSV